MVPGSKTSRAQPCRRGMAAWCSWKTHWDPVDAGEAAATGERCRDPEQRLETSTAQRDADGEAWQGVGSPLEQPPLMAGSAGKAPCVYPPAMKPRKEFAD